MSGNRRLKTNKCNKMMNALEIISIIIYCVVGVVFAFPFAYYAFMKMVHQNRVNMAIAMFIGLALATVWPLTLLGMSVGDRGA